MGIPFIVLFFLIIIVLVALLVFLREKHRNNLVTENSLKIASLLELNEKTNFHRLDDIIDLHKHYDNKSNFNRIDPSFLLTAEIKANIAFYSSYITKIHDNQEAKIRYDINFDDILYSDKCVDCESLKIPQEEFLKRENKILEKLKLSPVVDCTINLKTTYSSPQGRVFLSKSDVLYFNDLVVCFDSLSRSHIDKTIRAQLRLLERGEVSDSLRYDILKRDNFSCVICGASAHQGVRLHVDHIIPISKGGKSTHDNLRTLCERCNIGKSNKLECETKTTEKVCELCGSKLIRRKSKYGEFYGCTRYPSCKFTTKL